MNAIDFVVRRHEAPRLGVLDREPERLKVQFPERALGHDRIVAEPLKLLLVGDKVLDARSDLL